MTILLGALTNTIATIIGYYDTFRSSGIALGTTFVFGDFPEGYFVAIEEILQRDAGRFESETEGGIRNIGTWQIEGGETDFRLSFGIDVKVDPSCLDFAVLSDSLESRLTLGIDMQLYFWKGLLKKAAAFVFSIFAFLGAKGETVSAVGFIDFFGLPEHFIRGRRTDRVVTASIWKDISGDEEWIEGEQLG